MEFQMSDKAKKVTLSILAVGVFFMVVGFFGQKKFAYPNVINEHELEVEFWAEHNAPSSDEIASLKEKVVGALGEGFKVEIHEAHSHAASEGEHGHDAHSHAEHEHHAQQVEGFPWNIHISHVEGGHDHGHGHTAPASEQLAAKFKSGELAFKDGGHRRFWSNLLVNGFFFMGIALGALFYLALHYATESGWGVVLLRIFEGISSALPIGVTALLIVFLAATFGMNHIYPWMDPEVVASDDIIYGKVAYLNKPFFWIRILAYFGVFLFFMNWFRKKSRQEDAEGGVEIHYSMYRRGALFLVFFAVFSSTMAWDVIMSIDTHWFSTLFGWYCFSGIWLSGMITVMMTTLYMRRKGFLPYVNDSHVHDVGKWMFALSFLWSYLWFSQFMLIWYSNIPEEVTYYVARISEYKVLYFSMFAINFVLPMLFFMSADTKKSAPYLIVVGLIIFIGHWVDVFCMVMPGTLFEEWQFGLLEIGMFMAFLGGFVYFVLNSISKSPLIQKNHPFLEESKHHNF